MSTAPYTMFGKTRDVEVEVYVNARRVEGDAFEKEIWIEREEEWYAFSNHQYQNKRVRVVTPALWKRAS